MLDAAYCNLSEMAHHRSPLCTQAMPVLLTLLDRQDGPATAQCSQLRHPCHAKTTLVVNQGIKHALFKLLRTQMRLEGHAK